MIFFYKIYKFVASSGLSFGIANTPRNLTSMENLFISYDKGSFSIIFVASVLLHIVMVIITMAFSELWEQKPSPIRAKIGVRFSQVPSDPIPAKNPKPVLKKIEKEWQPKLSNYETKKPELLKPVLKDTPHKSTLPVPEAPNLKISESQIVTSPPSTKLSKISDPKVTKFLKKPKLIPTKSSEFSRLSRSLPKLSKDHVPLSPLTSKKSRLNPSQFVLPKISMDDITQKNINEPMKINPPKKLNNSKFNNTQKFFKPKSLPSISQVKPSEKSVTKLEEIFPDKLKFEEPLPEMGVLEQAEEGKLKDIPDTLNLQRKKLAQLAGEEYNLHIRTRIIPKLGSYSSELYVRIRLKIIPTGKIIDYEIIKKSGFAAFDKAAELAVRNALLDPLPNALAKNPPYIVTIRIVPQS